MTITCPHCGATGELDDSKRPVGVTSIKCPRCSQGFPLPPAVTPPSTEPPPLRACPSCGGVIENDGQFCNACAKARERQSETAMTPPPLPDAEKENFSVCTVCKGQFSLNEMVRFGDKLVCASCKPTYMQMLSMGISDRGSYGDGTLSPEELAAREYTVDIGGCLTAGWEMFKANMGIVIGASILVYLSMGIANAIPFLGYISALVLTGPFMGGLWIFYIKKMRGEDATINDAFSGFNKNFIQLMLVGAVSMLISYAAIIASLIPLFVAIGTMGLFRNGSFVQGAASTAIIIPVVLFFLVGIAAFSYLTVCWVFAIPLVIDKNMQFWPAMQLSRKMVGKQWWMTFLFLTVVSLVGSLGIIALVIGIIFTGPIAFAAIVAHYRNVFDDLRPE